MKHEVAVTLEQVSELEVRFTYHAPQPGQVDRYNALREQAREFAAAVVAMVPESREQALALTKIEEAVMWANAGIARRDPVEEVKP